jgi:hypothetical protein
MSDALMEQISAQREEKERQDLLADRARFEALYARWLETRAALASFSDDDRDEVMEAKQNALDEASRQFMIYPAPLAWMIWQKWEVLEFYLDDDILAGRHADSRTLISLACIKADLIRLGIGKAEE